MRRPDPEPPPDQLRLDPLQCPYCGETTMPNLLADGSYICSCPAERGLPLGDGQRGMVMPPPADDTSFVAPRHLPPDRLPGDRGQFGRDVQTEDFWPLRAPPGERK